MKKRDEPKTQPITARALDSLIRLATAFAKARLSEKVEPKDVEEAIGLIEHSYYYEVPIGEEESRRVNLDSNRRKRSRLR